MHTKSTNELLYRSQRILEVKIDKYAYLVPYVEDEDKVFLGFSDTTNNVLQIRPADVLAKPT